MIEETYVAPGQVRFEFRNFPFLGEESVLAAEASLCAEDQGEFWPYHDLLFANQGNPTLDGFSIETLELLAEHLGLDTESFSTCLNNHEHRDEVEQSLEDAKALGVQGTPSFAINGELVMNLETYGDLLDQIDAAIAASQ